MAKSFETFVKAWKELTVSNTTEINEATLTLFLLKHFGTSKNNFTHYRSLSLKLGFISANKDKTYSIDVKAVDSAFETVVI